MSRLKLAVVLFIFGLAADATAQRPTPGPEPEGTQSPSSFVGTLVVRVRDHRGVMLPRQALIHLYSDFTTVNITEPTRGGGEATFRNLPVGNYRVEVTALGYEKADEEVSIYPSSAPNYAFVGLRPESIQNTENQAPPTAPPVLAPKARKELEAGLEALKTGHLEIAQKHLERALKLAPGNPDVNYLVGVLYLKLNEEVKAKRHLEKAVQLQPDHYQALAALGILLLHERDYPAVIRTLEQALVLNPQSWDGHNAIARAYWAEGQYEKSGAHARRALELGEPRAPDLRILLALTLAKLGEREKAASELELFLQRYPDHRAAGNAQRFLAQVRERLDAAVPAVPADLVQTPTPAAAMPALAFPNWAPPDVDTAVPPVATDPPCSLPAVLASAGRQTKALVENLQRFTALEQIEYARLADDGTFKFTEEQKVSYLVFIQEIRPGMLSVEEMREGGKPPTFSPMRTNGLAGMALVFHPYYAGDFEMRCEGLGQWQGQPAWQVYFRQREDRPARIHRIRSDRGSFSFDSKLKGRAWIAANSSNVVRLEADSIEPYPSIELERHYLVIEYQPVQFSKRKLRLWLPSHAELYLHLRGRRYRHRHDFSDYKLFSVDVSEKIQPPQ